MGVDFSAIVIVGIEADDAIEHRDVETGVKTKYNPDTGKPYKVKQTEKRVFFYGEDVTELAKNESDQSLIDEILKQRGVRKHWDDVEGEIRAYRLSDDGEDGQMFIGRIFDVGGSNGGGCNEACEIDVEALKKEVAALLKQANIQGEPKLFVGLTAG